MLHTLGHGKGAYATGQNTVSCAAKKVRYGGPEVVKMKCPKHYMETDVLGDRRKRWATPDLVP